MHFNHAAAGFKFFGVTQCVVPQHLVIASMNPRRRQSGQIVQ
jgi:hypothetical protein